MELTIVLASHACMSGVDSSSGVSCMSGVDNSLGVSCIPADFQCCVFFLRTIYVQVLRACRETRVSSIRT